MLFDSLARSFSDLLGIKNRVVGLLELDLNDKYSFSILDMVNYGNDKKSEQKHYYNVGGAYRVNSTRIGLSYGCQ